MIHRVDAIISRIADILRDQLEPQGVHVYEHRRLSLAEDQDELPAVSVDFGADEPATETTGHVDSILTIRVTTVVSLPTEEDVKRELLRLRRDVHVALMADRTLELPEIVIDTAYGGADEPDYDVGGEMIAGALTAMWPVMYRMPHDDPGA